MLLYYYYALRATTTMRSPVAVETKLFAPDRIARVPAPFSPSSTSLFSSTLAAVSAPSAPAVGSGVYAMVGASAPGVGSGAYAMVGAGVGAARKEKYEGKAYFILSGWFH